MNNNDEIISIFLNVSMCFAKTLLHRCEPIIDNTAIGIHNSVHPGAINLYIKETGKLEDKNNNQVLCMEQPNSILDNVFIV